MKTLILSILLLTLSGCLNQEPKAEAKQKELPKKEEPPMPGYPPKHMILKTGVYKISEVPGSMLEKNQSICEKTFGVPFEFKMDHTALAWAAENKVESWRKIVRDEKSDLLLDVVEVMGLESQLVRHGDKPKPVNEFGDVCFIPIAVRVTSTAIAIELSDVLQKQNELRDVTAESEFDLIRGGIQWSPKQVLPGNIRIIDNLRVNWYIEPGSLPDVKDLIYDEYGFDPEIQMLNGYEIFKQSGANETLIQFSSDGFKSDNTVWIESRTVGDTPAQVFANAKIGSGEINPWKLDEAFKGNQLISGVGINAYSALSLESYKCGNDHECVNPIASSIREVFARALSPSKTKGSLWVRFLWDHPALHQTVISTVEVDVKSGEIKKITSRLQTPKDKLPEVLK